MKTITLTKIKRWTLTRPLKINLEQYNDESCLAVNKHLGIYAWGPTEKKALAEFKYIFALEQEFYSKTPHTGLIGLAVKLKKRYAVLLGIKEKSDVTVARKCCGRCSGKCSRHTAD